MVTEGRGTGKTTTTTQHISHLFFSPSREWAVPGGTAIPGQPVGKPEQAPASLPRAKNQFNIEVPQWDTYQILS